MSRRCVSIASNNLARWYAGSLLRSFSTSLANRISYTPIELHMRSALSIHSVRLPCRATSVAYSVLRQVLHKNWYRIPFGTRGGSIHQLPADPYVALWRCGDPLLPWPALLELLFVQSGSGLLPPAAGAFKFSNKGLVYAYRNLHFGRHFFLQDGHTCRRPIVPEPGRAGKEAIEIGSRSGFSEPILEHSPSEGNTW